MADVEDAYDTVTMMPDDNEDWSWDEGDDNDSDLDIDNSDAVSIADIGGLS